MKRKMMLVDVNLCHDCNNCFLACKDEHCGNDWEGQPRQPKHGHRWINILRKERGQFPMIDMVFLPVMCMQCDDAPCVAVGAGAVEKRPDGIVRINYKKITGNDKLQEYCPYGAIYFNSEANVPQKCDFCAHLLDEGEKEPRCVSVCPTGALTFREVDESEYATLLENGWEVYGQARSTSVLYKNLDRFEKYFLGGSLVRSGDCAGNETVKLKQFGNVILQATSNAFGDFKFDFLEAGNYVVEVADREIEVELNESMTIGDIEL